MLYEKAKKVNDIKGSSFLSPAHGLGGARATILFLSALPPPEKIAGDFQQAGKKEGGLGEGIFARLLSAEGGMGWESVSAILPLAEYQNRKFFFSLIEKKLGGRRLKKCRENFSVLLAEAKRRRAETLGGIYSKSASGFSLKKVRILFRTDSQFVKFGFPASLGASPLASANEFSSNFQTSQSFVPPSAGRQSGNFLPKSDYKSNQIKI